MYKITVPTLITNGHFNREKTLAEIKRCGAQRIALAIGRELDFSFTSTENLDLLKDLIKYFGENGLEVLVWLGETMGHEGGKPSGKPKYTGIRLVGGEVIKAFCPMDKNFIADLCTWVKNVANCGAKMIMLDDDFRLGCRGNGPGCCCDLHMSAFCEELGENIRVDELKEKVFSGDRNKYRDAWLKIQGDSMRNLARHLREALDSVNPEARLGLCCSPNTWDTDGCDTLELIEILAGKTKPFMRTIGAPYWSKNIGETVELVRTQLSWSKGHEAEIFSEGDTYPRPRFATPASFLECYDMMLRADAQTSGILKYMLDYVSDADYETGYIDAMLANKKLYQKIDELFSDKHCVGVRLYNKMHLIKNSWLDPEDDNILSEIQKGFLYPSIAFAVKNSLPISYETGGVNILFGENARHITEKELKCGNIIDITAAKILISRGIDVGIEAIGDNLRYNQDGFSDTLSEYYFEEKEYTRLDPGVKIAEVVHKPNVKILTGFTFGKNIKNGVFEYQNADGLRFLVFPFNMFKAITANGWIATYARRRLVLKSLGWLGEKPLDAYPDGNYPQLYIMVKKNETGMSIGLWNLFEDKIPSLKIHVSGIYENAEFVNCSGHCEKGLLVLDSVLYPYEFAAIELKRR